MTFRSAAAHRATPSVASFRLLPPKLTPLGSSAAIGAAVFVCCMIGIWTRPAGLLAAFWPANPVLLGLLLRSPGKGGPLPWLFSAIAYLSADLLVGGKLVPSMWLAAANLAAVGAGYVVLRYAKVSRFSLERSDTAMRLYLGCMAAGVATATVGCWTGPLFFGEPAGPSWLGWFASELANCAAILPVVLAATNFQDSRRQLFNSRMVGPWALLGAGAGMAGLVGGAGAMAFSLPALTWGALRGGILVTATMALLATGWIVYLLGDGRIDHLTFLSEISTKVGVALIALAPIAVASAAANQARTMATLRRRALEDSLTGTLNRQGFFEDGKTILDRMRGQGRRAAVLMLDIDWFKQFNDDYGHNFGDRVLAEFTRVVRQQIREGDVLGRYGGEEFAILLVDVDEDDTIVVAERIREAVEELRLRVEGRTVGMTVSIGIAMMVECGETLDSLVRRADQALYVAKGGGRNMVVMPDGLEEHS